MNLSKKLRFFSIRVVLKIVGLLCDPVDPHDIAAKLHQLLGDAELQNKLRSKDMQRVQAFPWKAMAEKTFAVYEKALS